jgi:hypothetical protein
MASNWTVAVLLGDRNTIKSKEPHDACRGTALYHHVHHKSPWTTLEMNPVICLKKPSTKCLRYGRILECK